MAKGNTDIKHTGVIREMTDTLYYISVERTTACVGCSAKKYCNLTDDKDELITVTRQSFHPYREGDTVTVVMQEQLGRRAIVFGYFIPFLVLIAGIVIPALCGLSEGLAGLIGIGATALYYVALALFRKKLDRKFVFRIE